MLGISVKSLFLVESDEKGICIKKKSLFLLYYNTYAKRWTKKLFFF